MIAIMAPSIVQYWHSRDVPNDIEELFDSFRMQNPELQHRVFSEPLAESFIAKHLSSREVDAFRACALPAMQADYFRCCALYVLGGVYADADLRCVGSLTPLVSDLEAGELFGWSRVPVALARFGLSDSSVWGDVDRVGAYRWVENGFFAFRDAEHPFLRLALDLMTANIHSRATENLIATTGPGVFTSLYLLRELGSFDAFIRYASHGVLHPVAQRTCEIVGSHENLAHTFEGVRISHVEKCLQRIQHGTPSYKDTSAYWMRWSSSIFR